MSAAGLDLRLHAQRAPQRLAVACGSQRLSYGELEGLANRLADVLRSLGLQRGEHLCSLLGNRPEGLALAWAAWRTGLYLTPIPATATAAEAAYLLRDSQAKALVVDGCLPAANTALQLTAGPLQALALLADVPGFVRLEPLLAQASPQPAAHEPPGALMMYTSGTTGAPKGVIRPLLPADWKGTPPFAADLIDLFGVGGEGVRYLSTAPLYHAAPLRTALAVTAGGGGVFVMERFEAEAALRLIEEEGITHSQWVPVMFQRLLRLPVERRAAFHAPAHRCAIHGAAPCPPALKQAMLDWWGPILLEYYSGSEGIGLTLITSQEALARPGSVGRVRKGVLHIAGPKGEALGVDQPGLVCFSDAAPFEYFNAPEKTKARALPHGWQTFGDVGFVDSEGYLFLTDRADDLIISGGVNVYPQEVEAVIRAVPGVADCAVVGVPSEAFGERPMAFVVADRTMTDAAEFVRTVAAHCERELGRVKRPDSIHLLDALPYTATGKLMRRALRTLPRAGAGPE